MATRNRTQIKVRYFKSKARTGWVWEIYSRGEVVARSLKTWPAKHHAKAAAASIKKNVATAEIVVEDQT